MLQIGPVPLLLLLSSAISAVLAFSIWRRRSSPGAAALVVLALAVSLWQFGYAFELETTQLSTKVLWAKVQYLGIVVVPPGWFAVALQYTRRERWLTRRTIVLLSVLPLATLLLAWTNEAHGLIWSSQVIDGSGQLRVLLPEYGPWFWIWGVYSYLALLAGFVVLADALLSSRGVYREQAIALFVSALVPWVTNWSFVIGATPQPRLDLTPFAFLVSVAALVWAFFRTHLLHVAPIARGAAFESMGDGVLVLDGRGQIVDCNPMGQRVISAGAASIIGRSVVEVWPQGPQVIHLAADAVTESVGVMLGEGNDRRVYDITVSPFRDTRGRLAGRLLVFHDTTERIRAEAALRESEAHYRDLYEDAPIPYFSVAPDGRVLTGNKRAVELLGYPPEAFVGRPVLDLFPDTLAGKARAETLFRRVASGEVFRDEEVELRQADGGTLWASLTIQPIQDPAGSLVESRAMVVDVTDKKRSEAALHDAKEEIEHQAEALALTNADLVKANQAKSEFLAHMSHELRTPLNAALGFAHLLTESAFGEISLKQRQFVENIITSGKHLLQIIDDIIDLSRSEISKLKLDFADVDVREWFQSCHVLIAGLASEKGVHLQVEYPPDGIVIRGDERRLKQIAFNLLTNAIKFTPEGGTVSLRSVLSKRDLRVSVKDTGTGIKKEHQDQVFDIFAQGGPDIAKRYGGSGLGLPLVRRLVELHGGAVHLKSAEGKGTTFTVVLPLPSQQQTTERDHEAIVSGASREDA